MIQVYTSGNTDFEHNGDAVLEPISCEVDMNLNGMWELTLEIPIDALGKWKILQVNSVIMAPTPVGKKQLFRVYECGKSMDGVMAMARPIFQDAANEVFLADVRPENCNGQNALDRLMSGTKYKGVSDITTVNTAYYIRKNLLEALASDADNSFLNRWGGEISYDNYTIYIHKRQGEDRGLRVEFGRNIEAISETVNAESVATRIYPVAFNGRTMTDGYVDSPNISKYPIIFTRTLECEDIKLKEDLSEGEDTENVIVCEDQAQLDAALRARCEEQYAAGMDVPKITYDVDMVDLSSKAEYAEFKALEEVRLGDTVHCKHRKLGIETAVRVVQVVYDSVRQINSHLVLGDYTGDYFSRLDSTTHKLDSLSNKVDENMLAASTLVTEASRRFDEKLAASSGLYCTAQIQPDGSTVWLLHDKPNLVDSVYVIKLTAEAIGFSTDGGSSYPYGFTVTGEMVASLLSANGVNCDWLRGGTVTLGGQGNVNGQLRILDASGKQIGKWDKDGISITAGSINLGDNFIATSSGKVTIKDGDINLTGKIEWNDLTSDAQSHAGGVTETRVHTLISGDLVESPTIKGAEVYGGVFWDDTGVCMLDLDNNGFHFWRGGLSVFSISSRNGDPTFYLQDLAVLTLHNQGYNHYVSAECSRWDFSNVTVTGIPGVGSFTQVYQLNSNHTEFYLYVVFGGVGFYTPVYAAVMSRTYTCVTSSHEASKDYPIYGMTISVSSYGAVSVSNIYAIYPADVRKIAIDFTASSVTIYAR